MEEHGGRGRGVGADRRGGASSISGDGFDFHTGDDRTPASAKVSQGGSGRASEKKKSGAWEGSTGESWGPNGSKERAVAGRGRGARGGRRRCRAQLLADMRFKLRLRAIRGRWCSGNWNAITWRSRYTVWAESGRKRTNGRLPRRRGRGTVTVFGGNGYWCVFAQSLPRVISERGRGL